MNKMKTLFTLALMCFFVWNTTAQTTKQPVKKTAPRATGATKSTTVKKPIAKIPATTVPATPAVVKLPGTRLKITTDLGNIVVRLYDETPQHRDNFIKLANEHFFDSLLFHRVMNTFMVQGGDPESKHAQPGQMLGTGGLGYTIPAEFNPAFYHKKGALAAARMPDHINPEKTSSACQYYIVHGRKWSDEELNGMDMQRAVKYTAEQRNMYKTIGGYAPLDMNYTVFGEVESGLDVVDKIASVPVAPGNRPYADVHMYIEVIK